ncbi:MAG: lipopolysaccharide biosynthesis protein [Gemmatimonadota bacterium]|nr:lipopolysaccharide biosynthesis protein [Gemmatimonadota bacterium]
MTGSTRGSQLGGRAFRAAGWQSALRAATAVLQLAVGIVLARLLPPEDFGLLGLALIITGLAALFSTLGIGPAIIQRPEVSTRHVRVSFTVSVLLGLAISAALFVVAPLSTLIFDNPQLPWILRVVGLRFIVSGFGTTAGALLRRRLQFKAVFWIGLSTYATGYAATAITLAVLGFGVWSLVIGSLAQAVLESVALVAVTRHSIKPLLSRPEMRELVGVGIGFSLQGILQYAASRGDNFVVGKVLGEGPLGLYTRAYALMDLPHQQAGAVVRQVLFPAFAEIQDQTRRVGRAYLLSVQVTTVVVAPLLAGMFVAAPHLITSVYGPAWVGSVAPLQVLCAFGTLRALFPLGNSVVQALGRVYTVAAVSLVYAVLVIAGALYGVRYGLSGVAFAVGVALLVTFLAISRAALKLLQRTWTEFLEALRAGVMLATLVGAVAWAARTALVGRGVGDLQITVILIVICGLTLLAGMWTFGTRLGMHDTASFLAERLGTRIGRLESWLTRLGAPKRSNASTPS